MRRRNLILGLLALASMGTAHAQQSGKAYRIAVVHPSHPVATLTETSFSPGIRAIFTELRRSGYVEGKNILIERYSGEGRAAQYPDLARDVVRRNPDLIIVIGNNLMLDLKAATTTIPIVGIFGAPIESGIVSNLTHPGGNITGVSVDIGQEQWEKRFQLLQQVVPRATRLWVIQSRDNWDRFEAVERENDRRAGITRIGQPLERPIDEAEYRRAFAAVAQDRPDAIMVNLETENITNRKLIVELAEKSRLPTIYPLKVFVEAGGLMSYGPDQTEHGSRAADIADQILKGAKPGDIPIFMPIKFELAINLRTAKALGLKIPPDLLAVADEVIE
jgi:putative tryptophan/tyrosine transport system substrate-binding protein